MELLKFTDLSLSAEMFRAVEEMGFETSTEIQTKAIPLIRSGEDVIGKSQTGTGKTMAFAIPAVEMIETKEHKPTVQILILCPTRELAQQACEEVKKLTKYVPGINAAEVYGGASMERQIMKLKRANIVIGTPGRIMDHLERRTLKLTNLKMVILDEADEMLNMGFKEDVETILSTTPEDKQTVLFSATMPPAIMALTKEFQHDPKLVEVNKKQQTLDNITQEYVDVPMGRKMDALSLLLHYNPRALTMIFSNTKAMVDDITQKLKDMGFAAEGLHGDMKQAVRTKVLDDFKKGRTSILVATDVAARGIDVNNIEFVINYDVPQNNEYYVHRIGRTGRAGKTGTAITICSGRRQVLVIKNIAQTLKSKIEVVALPTAEQITSKLTLSRCVSVETELAQEINPAYVEMVNEMLAKGHSLHNIAAAALQLNFGKEIDLPENIVSFAAKDKRASGSNSSSQKLRLSIGRAARVAPNHIVGAITERTVLNGSQIGKIEIFDDYTLVGVPADTVDSVVADLMSLKICGKPVKVSVYTSSEKSFKGKPQRSFKGEGKGKGDGRGKSYKDRGAKRDGKGKRKD